MSNLTSFNINGIDTSINLASETDDGLMSSQDYTTLNTISSGVNLYSSATTEDEKIYPSSAFEIIDNADLIEATIDSDDFLLESTDINGKKTFYQDVEIKGSLINSELNTKFDNLLIDTSIITNLQKTDIILQNNIDTLESSVGEMIYCAENGGKYAWVILDSSENIVLATDGNGTLTDCFGIADAVNTVNTFEERITALENDTSVDTSVSVKNIICWGDSLTAAGKYETYLQSSLGSSYKVYNCGVGGEKTREIMARCGAVPTYTQRDIIIPANGSYVEISTGSIDTSIFSNLVIKDVDNTEYSINLLRQGAGNSVNPCYLNDIECTLMWSGSSYNDSNGKYYIKRNETYSHDVTVLSGSQIIFKGFTYRAPYAAVIWIGQNGGYSGNDMLVQQIQATIKQCATEHYVIVGLHTNTAAYRQSLEEKMSEAFGDIHYINWRKYTAEQGMYDAIDNGLVTEIRYHDGDDVAIINDYYSDYLVQVDTSTYSDVEYMANGRCPRALLSDSTHHNTVGYTLLGMQIERRLHYIGAI